MQKTKKMMHYTDYLQLAPLLSCQHPYSERGGEFAHDEMLFIITHQTYELWFKQVLHDLDSILEIFAPTFLDDRHMGTVIVRLKRIGKILDLLLQQLSVIETMTPLNFLDFRDSLGTMSGFQSHQFRLIENKLGLEARKRLSYAKCPYSDEVSHANLPEVKHSEKAPSLFSLVERWLERTPFINRGTFSFLDLYRLGLTTLLKKEEAHISENHDNLTPEHEEILHKRLTNLQEHYSTILSNKEYTKCLEKGERRLSYKAMIAALFIRLYSHEPALAMADRVLTALLDVDTHLSHWRFRHSLMTQKMIGNKLGTGGSSGQHYLRETVLAHQVFSDLHELTTLLLPRSVLPELSESLKKDLDFSYTTRIDNTIQESLS